MLQLTTLRLRQKLLKNVISLSGAVEEGDVYNISLNNGSSLEYTVTADDAAGGADALQASLISAASGSLTGVMCLMTAMAVSSLHRAKLVLRSKPQLLQQTQLTLLRLKRSHSRTWKR